MTDKEKLERAIKFIEKIEKMDIPTCDIEDFVTITGECSECGCSDIDIETRGTAEVINPKDLDSIKHEAWQVLVDLKY